MDGASPGRPVDLLRQFGVCSDEISEDLAVALDLIRELGLGWVELYHVWGKPLTELTPAEVDAARRLLDRHRLRVSSVGSLLLKPTLLGDVPAGRVADDPAFRAELARLRASIRNARDFGTTIVRTFSFRRDEMVGLGNPSPRLPRGGPIPEAMLEKIAEGFAVLVEEAGAAGVTLALENVRSCWGNTGHNAARIIERVGSPVLRALWDPGNDYVSGGVPYPDGYAAIRPSIAHIHIKDARVIDPATGLTSWEAVGAGEVDYPGHLAALAADGYRGTLSLETHWHPPGSTGVEDSRRSFAGIRAALGLSPAPESPPAPADRVSAP
jgi:sugar phosphate isomerase/epimerase